MTIIPYIYSGYRAPLPGTRLYVLPELKMMIVRIVRNAAIFLAALYPCTIAAQMPESEILKNIGNMSGIYTVYPDVHHLRTPAPEGYSPFYISHLGRHGSRWHSSHLNYERTLEKLEQGRSEGKTTPLGDEVYSLVKILAEDARGRYGELSPRGVAEHRHIAERMYLSYPEVFSTDHGRICRIEAYSSNVVRCVLSMAASNERLKELNPEIIIERSSSQRNMDMIFNRPECMKIAKEISKEKNAAYRKCCNPDRLLGELFTDYGFIPEDRRWEMLYDMYMLASICRDVDYLGIDLFRYLTPEEVFGIWSVKNGIMYLQSGPSARFGKRALSDAEPSLRHIISCADEALSSGRVAATLRYGHDQNVIPLAALMGLDGCDTAESDMSKVHDVWCDFIISPMACNIQMVFFRKEGSDDILVKILLNEKETKVNGLSTDCFPYYHWTLLRSYLLSRIEECL